jgi:hypothetical protein
MSGQRQFPLDEFELYNLARAFRAKTYRLVRQRSRGGTLLLGETDEARCRFATNNIAEGHGRWHYSENIQFCRTSRGSIEELIDDFNTCLDESYGDESLVHQLKADANNLIHRINGYIAYLRKRKQGE